MSVNLTPCTKYLIDKIIDPNINFFDEHPCKLRKVIGSKKCDDGSCPFAIGKDICSALLLKSEGLGACLKEEYKLYGD